MRNFKYFLLSGCLAFFVGNSIAQTFDDPGSYMTAISNAQNEMNQKYMVYMSAAGHGRRARKVEKLRIQTLEGIGNTKYKIIGLPLYKGDNTLRKSSIDYIQFCYNVFNDDYSKIVNMEEIAEQSVDQMQAYLLLQEKTESKLKEASETVNKAGRDFAAKYNIKIIESKDELGNKIEIAGKLTHYTNQVFIVFFKCNWEDGELTKALNNKKIIEAEQARNALINYSNEGLQVLASDSLKSFQRDPALAQACRQAVVFYKKTAENEMPKMLDFYLKEENFEKIKKVMDAKASKTKEDVTLFNKAVKEINDGVNAFNQTNQMVNANRNQIHDNWEKAEKSFTDVHMPYYKK